MAVKWTTKKCSLPPFNSDKLLIHLATPGRTRAVIWTGTDFTTKEGLVRRVLLASYICRHYETRLREDVQEYINLSDGITATNGKNMIIAIVIRFVKSQIYWLFSNNSTLVSAARIVTTVPACPTPTEWLSVALAPITRWSTCQRQA